MRERTHGVSVFDLAVKNKTKRNILYVNFMLTIQQKKDIEYIFEKKINLYLIRFYTLSSYCLDIGEREKKNARLS